MRGLVLTVLMLGLSAPPAAAWSQCPNDGTGTLGDTCDRVADANAASRKQSFEAYASGMRSSFRALTDDLCDDGQGDVRKRLREATLSCIADVERSAQPTIAAVAACRHERLADVLARIADARHPLEKAITASTLEAMRASRAKVDAVRPPIERIPGPFDAQYYLSDGSALGDMGILGAYSILNKAGGVTPDALMDLFGDWSPYADELTAQGGPGSEDGPLGPAGPLNDVDLYITTAVSCNDFMNHLGLGGLYTALGPFGAHGPLGPNGYLGGSGGHGFDRDDCGRFTRSSGDVVRQVDVDYLGGKRTYDLHETYAEDCVGGGQFVNDTSFSVKGVVTSDFFAWPDPFAGGNEVDAYAFQPAADEVVTLTLTPGMQLDRFRIEMVDSVGHVVASSRSRHLINFIQAPVRGGETYTVRVSLSQRQHTARQLPATYTLITVGSTPFHTTTSFSGPHQAQ